MANITADFSRTVGKHFISLSCVQIVDGRRIPVVSSGFLFDAKGAWFFVTAGHVLREIALALDSGSEFDIWRLDDQASGNKKQMPAIPYDFDINKWVVIEDKTIGLDYAVLYLEDIYVRQLESGGAEPIRKNAWGDYIQNHDHWVLIGIPSESVHYDGSNTMTAKFSVIPVKESESPPSEKKPSVNRFYAKLVDMGNVTDISGMSGGPIFSLKKIDNTWFYQVIGVQSGWYRQSKIIYACPVKALFEEIEEIVQSNMDETT
jgi:hypothetical protein